MHTHMHTQTPHHALPILLISLHAQALQLLTQLPLRRLRLLLGLQQRPLLRVQSFQLQRKLFLLL